MNKLRILFDWKKSLFFQLSSAFGDLSEKKIVTVFTGGNVTPQEMVNIYNMDKEWNGHWLNEILS